MKAGWINVLSTKKKSFQAFADIAPTQLWFHFKFETLPALYYWLCKGQIVIPVGLL